MRDQFARRSRPSELCTDGYVTCCRRRLVRVAPGWLTSLVVHVLLLLLLGVASLPVANAPSEHVLSIRTSVEVDVPDLLVDLGLPEIDYETPGSVPLFPSTPTLVSPPIPNIDLDDSSRFGIVAVSGTGRGVGRTDRRTSLESKTRGKRFVFVIDRSSSMTGDKFEAIREEILHLISLFGAEDEFSVVFFPMVGEQGQLLSATPQNVTRVKRWIGHIKVGSGSKGFFRSVRRAIELKPDTLFLVTDGLMNDRDIRFVQRALPAGTKLGLNTICVNYRDNSALKRLAEQSGGTHRFVSAGSPR